jgi:hypothetical protein
MMAEDNRRGDNRVGDNRVGATGFEPVTARV